VAGYAIRSRSAGHTGRSVKTHHALRLKPDHSIGADHRPVFGKADRGHDNDKIRSKSCVLNTSKHWVFAEKGALYEVRFNLRRLAVYCRCRA